MKTRLLYAFMGLAGFFCLVYGGYHIAIPKAEPLNATVYYLKKAVADGSADKPTLEAILSQADNARSSSIRIQETNEKTIILMASLLVLISSVCLYLSLCKGRGGV